MNNHWGTNYRAYQEGVTTFRYVLIPHRAANPAANTRLATAFTQPLLVRPATGPAAPSVPRLTLSTDDVVVTSLKPSDDGRAWIVRLYGASGKDTDVTLRWSDASPAQMYLSDTTERVVKKIEGKIAVPAWDVVTIRAEGVAARSPGS
jgi:alpha-mannosidase